MDPTLVSSATGLAFCFELCAGSGQRASEDEAGEGAVDAATRVDALDNLLAEVAALGEVQGASLAGLLREVAGCIGVADVCAEAGRAFEDAKVVEGNGGDCDGSSGEEVRGERGDGCGARPEFESGTSGL